MKQKITTFLTFNNQAEEAVKFYTSIFENSKINSISYYPNHIPGLGGKAMSLTFELNNQIFYALNAGPSFKFEQGISLFIDCKNQEEVDYFWDNLTKDGQELQCGWLKDKFGVSWQVIPQNFGQLLGSKDPEKAKRVMDAMLKMKKIDTKILENA